MWSDTLHMRTHTHITTHANTHAHKRTHEHVHKYTLHTHTFKHMHTNIGFALMYVHMSSTLTLMHRPCTHARKTQKHIFILLQTCCYKCLHLLLRAHHIYAHAFILTSFCLCKLGNSGKYLLYI